MKKFFGIFAVVALLGAAFAACSNDEPNPNEGYRLYNEADSAAFCEIMKAAYGPYLPGLSYAMGFTLDDASSWPKELVIWEMGGEFGPNKRIVWLNLYNLFESTGLNPSESWPSEKFGHISPAVWDLECLTYFRVESEMFHGEVPECGDGATRLSLFYLDNTNITSLPLDIFTRPNLTNLHCSHNMALKHLPDGIENIPFKDKLACTIRNSGLTGAAPMDIKLRFGLEKNEYTSVDWDGFRKVDILEMLANYEYSYDLEGNRISGSIPDDILADTPRMLYLFNMTDPQQEGYGFDNMPSLAELYAMKQAYIEEHPDLAELLDRFYPFSPTGV